MSFGSQSNRDTLRLGLVFPEQEETILTCKGLEKIGSKWNGCFVN